MKTMSSVASDAPKFITRKGKKQKAPPSPGSNDLGTYIASEVAGAVQDYQIVRTRSLSLLTTSGGLLTLVSGLLAIAVGTGKVVIPLDSRWTISVALGSFVASTICALIINIPQSVTSSDETKLGALVERHWNIKNWNQKIAAINVTYLISLRRDNGRRTNWLTATIIFQILGIAFIAISAFLILLHSP